MSRYDYRHRYDRYSFYPQSKSKDERMADAAKKQKALEKKGAALSPVVLDGFAITTTCWGKAWCKNVESYHDYVNRLPRGRSYVRSNSVIDLQIAPGVVRAQVMGSSLYHVDIGIKPVAKAQWAAIRTVCGGKIGSLIELLQGRISSEVMAVMTQPGEGLFPKPAEITFRCSCPDIAGLCKHIAAVLYGIGSRLDRQPELLFLLRGVDTADLIAAAADAPAAADAAFEGETLAADDLAGVFDVEIEAEAVPAPVAKSEPKPRGRPKKVAASKPSAQAVPPANKKPRGLPKKTVKKKTVKVETAASTAGSIPKMGRRPKKQPASPPLTKRPRGRPPKKPPTN